MEPRRVLALGDGFYVLSTDEATALKLFGWLDVACIYEHAPPLSKDDIVYHSRDNVVEDSRVCKYIGRPLLPYAHK